MIRLIPNGASLISDIPEKSVTPIHNETRIIQNMQTIPMPISETRTVSMASSEPFNQSVVNILTRIDNSVSEMIRLIPNGALLISGIPEKLVTPIHNETRIIQNMQTIPMPISETVSTINTITPDVTQAITEISVSIKHIDSSVADILRSIASIPYIKIRDDNEGYASENPRNRAPVTQAERIAYSLQERRETVAIEVSTAKDAEARITHASRDINIQLVRSGGNS
jgi:hypothetical protein